MSTTTDQQRREPRGVLTTGRPALTTIPTSDRSFAQAVRRLASEMDDPGPDDLAARLRRLFPRVAVRVRQLAGERDTWYVYRDGAWRRDETVAWWRQPRVPRVDVGLDGRIVGLSPAARSLLGIETEEGLDITAFVVPDAVADAATLFEILKEGPPVDATVRIRPLTGDVIACDVHCRRRGDRLTAWLRLAEDIAPEPSGVSERPAIEAHPADDVVFTAYVADTLAAISPASPAELEIRLHRLYPHARVKAMRSRWLVTRDRDRETGRARGTADLWWLEPGLPTVRYDGHGLILAANDAAEELLGRGIVGRHWHELATPGSSTEVDQVMSMIKAAGSAVSRFRMPAADGSLVEFDSRTDVQGDDLVTVMRPVRVAASGRRGRRGP